MSPEQSVISVAPTAIAAVSSPLHVRTRDAYGNYLVAGSDSVSLILRTPVGEGLTLSTFTVVIVTANNTNPTNSFVDYGNGTYFTAFSVTVAGVYTLEVMVGSVLAAETSVTVEPASETHAASCIASGPGWNGAFWDSPASFEVVARDQYGASV